MTRLKMKFGIMALAIAGALGIAATATATSVTYDFSHNIGGNTSYTGTEFTVTVSDLGNSLASFVFHNHGPASSAITGIYFYGSAVDGSTASIDHSDTTGYFPNNAGAPANLAGGIPYGLSSPSFYSKAQGINGIRGGQSLTITMELTGTFADLISAIDSGLDITKKNKFSAGDFAIGLHVQGLPGSDQYLMGTETEMSVIPLPAPVWMGLTGLLAVVVIRRRR